MRAFGYLVRSTLAGALAKVAYTGVVLANGGDVHVSGGATGIPKVAIYAVAGVVLGLVALALLAGWMRQRRSATQSPATSSRVHRPAGKERSHARHRRDKR